MMILPYGYFFTETSYTTCVDFEIKDTTIPFRHECNDVVTFRIVASRNESHYNP